MSRPRMATTNARRSLTLLKPADRNGRNHDIEQQRRGFHNVGRHADKCHRRQIARGPRLTNRGIENRGQENEHRQNLSFVHIPTDSNV
jgi:hypothetical protein